MAHTESGENSIGRKRRLAIRTALTGSVFWLVLALLVEVTHRLGLSRTTPADLRWMFVLAAGVIAVNYLYFRTPLYRRTGWSFRAVGLFFAGLHAMLPLMLYYLDGFTLLTVFVITIGAPAVISFMGLQQAGMRPPLVMGAAMTVFIDVLYAFAPQNPHTLTPPELAMFQVCWGALIVIMALLNEINVRQRKAIVRLYRQQQSQNELIQQQNEELARKSRALDRANRSLQQLSLLDALTGVANRRHFDEALEREWQAARERRAMPGGSSPAPDEGLALLMVDIDHFKAYNDCYGHVAGDECLRRVAWAIQSATRRTSDLAARYGGEEFAVLLPEAGRRGALEVARRILQNVRALELPHADSPVAGEVTVSVGMACLEGDDAVDPLELVVRTDQALYRAKHGGRRRIEEYAA
ncbi:MAG TPA: diguanylate cyclase [Gammaproteobacteria bacterium]|nr:diguanylate cyclase [Gammaproteobacteria bacterium]